MEITEHDLIENEQGELLLLLEKISDKSAEDPAILTSKTEMMAWFHRGPEDIHEIVGINPNVIERLRAAESVLIMEMTGEEIVHLYDAPAAILEDALAED